MTDVQPNPADAPKAGDRTPPLRALDTFSDWGPDYAYDEPESEGRRR